MRSPPSLFSIISLFLFWIVDKNAACKAADCCNKCLGKKNIDLNPPTIAPPSYWSKMEHHELFDIVKIVPHQEVLEVERLDKQQRANKERTRRMRWIKKREGRAERDKRLEQDRQAGAMEQGHVRAKHPQDVRTEEEETQRTKKLIARRLERDNRESVQVGPFVRLIGFFKKKGESFLTLSVRLSVSLSHTLIHTLCLTLTHSITLLLPTILQCLALWYTMTMFR